MRARAVVGVVGVWLVACATGTQPSDSNEALSGQGGTETAGTGASAGEQTQAGSANGSGSGGGGAGMTGGNPNASGTSGSSSGSPSNAGTGGSEGGAGGTSAGAGGMSGSGGSAGTGGTPNQSKPTSITVSATRNATAKHSPSTGGTSFDDACPNNQVLIGFRGTIDGAYMGAGIRSIGGVCGTLSVGAASPYAVTTSSGGQLPERNSPTTGVEMAMCPANQVVVGFSGKSGMYMEALSFRCAPLSITGNSPTFQLQVGNATNTGLLGDENTGADFAAINCAAGEVAVSQMINAGDAIDNFGLRCAALSLVVQ